MSDYNHVATYLSDDQLARWEDHSAEMGFRLWSEFVEAGLKKFDGAGIEPDETNSELREQRNDLKTELDRARDRIRELEAAVYDGERQEISEFVEANPGATYDEIIQHVMVTVPERVTEHLNDLEGETLRNEDDGYYLRDEMVLDSGGP